MTAVRRHVAVPDVQPSLAPFPRAHPLCAYLIAVPSQMQRGLVCLIGCFDSAGHRVARKCAPSLVRRTACGRKGATLQHPSWEGSDVGWALFPTPLS